MARPDATFAGFVALPFPIQISYAEVPALSACIADLHTRFWIVRQQRNSFIRRIRSPLPSRSSDIGYTILLLCSVICTRRIATDESCTGESRDANGNRYHVWGTVDGLEEIYGAWLASRLWRE